MWSNVSPRCCAGLLKLVERKAVRIYILGGGVPPGSIAVMGEGRLVNAVS